MNTQKTNKGYQLKSMSYLINRFNWKQNPENSTHLQHLHEKNGSQIYNNNDANIGH